MFKKIVCIILLAVILVSNSLIYADNCNIISSKNIYNNNNQYTYKNNVIEYVDVIQKRVEFDADYFIGLNGYYDVVNELQEQEVTKDKDIYLKQSDQIDKLITLLEILIKNKQSESNNVINNNQSQTSNTNTNVKPNVNTGGSDKFNAETLNKKVFTIFKDNCMGCHGQTSPKAGLQLVGENEDGSNWLNDLSLTDRILVYDSVSGTNLKERGKKLMPLGGSPLSDSEVQDIKLWMILKAEQEKRGN